MRKWFDENNSKKNPYYVQYSLEQKLFSPINKDVQFNKDVNQKVETYGLCPQAISFP